MIDLQRIKENKDLSYLASWYCPLEKAGQLGINNINSGKVTCFSSALYTPGLTFDKIPLRITNRHVMAGF